MEGFELLLLSTGSHVVPCVSRRLTARCPRRYTSDMKKVFSAKPIRTVFHMEPGHRKALDAISKKTGAPLAELLRRAVVLFLKSKGRKIA